MDNTWIKARRWGAGGLAAALAAALMAACGGGGGSSTGGGTTASTFAAGPISGFGSIIVNGVRFDDSGAEVENEDGGGSRSDLKLGTMVEIESEAIDDSTGRAKAVKIRFGSETVGPVESVAADGASMIVIGQTVDIKPETVFDDSLPTTLAELAGKVVEVHGQIDAATGHIVATRVEDKADAAFFKVRGVVAGLDTTAKTFTIGTATISYAGIADADLPAQFADGLKVRVRLQTVKNGEVWNAVTIRSGVRKVEDHDDARLRGTVGTVTDDTHFDVNGVAVDASTARIDNGPVTSGAQVEVRGTAKDGVIIATRVKVLVEDGDEVRGIELHGTISSLDTTAKTFTLRDTKVDYSGTVLFKDGAEANLADGAQVEVKGRLSADRSTLTAVLIEFER